MKRKRIALVTINPENEVVSCIMHGVFAQCKAYDYDVAVISPLVHSSHYFKDYLKGELRIYDIINFDLFDGVIITPYPMQEEQNTEITDMLLEKFKKECKIPVVSLDAQFGDSEVVCCDEKSGMMTVTRHLIVEHGCRDIMVLTGPETIDVSVARVNGIREAMEAEGLTLADDHIVYGDFWYTSGEQLARRIADGECSKPQAVICTSDHMAIGLANTLIELGINVPEDIRVTGFGGSMDAAINYPPITTFDYDEEEEGANAVNRLVAAIEPGREIIPARFAGIENMCMGTSCGCSENTYKLRKKVSDFVNIKPYKKNSYGKHGIAMSELMDSYILESFTAVNSVDECLKKIYESLYLLKPYTCAYLCLNTDWLEVERKNSGYTKSMNLVIYSDMAKKLHGYPNHVFWGRNKMKSFPRSAMLPVFDNQMATMIPGMEDAADKDNIFDKPQVYYFTPIHIGEISLGYMVLQNSLDYSVRVNGVYRSYLRFLNNALEMSRAKDIIVNISEHDQLTGLYNRRGMERAYEEWRQDILKELAQQPDKKYNVLAMMIDMNNLKLINDTEGHDAGDQGIKAIADAAALTATGREFTVRGGGDEFYLIGIGEYTDADGERLTKEFKHNLMRENRKLGQSANYTAAVGFAIVDFQDCADYHTVLDEADVKMYVDKRMSKHGRR